MTIGEIRNLQTEIKQKMKKFKGDEQLEKFFSGALETLENRKRKMMAEAKRKKEEEEITEVKEIWK